MQASGQVSVQAPAQVSAPADRRADEVPADATEAVGAAVVDPSADEVPAPRRRTVRRWLLVAAFVAVVAVTTVLGLRQGGPSRHPVSYRYALPSSFRGLADDPDDPMVVRMQAAPGSALAAAYGSPSTGRITVVASQAQIPYPDTESDRLTASSSDLLAHARQVDPGPLGGVMVCASHPWSGAVPGPGTADCAWFDAGGFMLFSEMAGGPENISLDQVAADARAFRLLAEQRV
ncbi:hypothetical protein ACFW1A_26280 [Kitasatospora sp. NPDC058965]|uniref:hypothetical protein n=1 Tax=Kitasatospora sp. NPDC058965 TaxID=3346682 RepID=UPI0036B9B50F